MYDILNSACTYDILSIYLIQGTFEERDITNTAHKLLQQYLQDYTIPLNTTYTLKITKCHSITGESTVIFTRGKAKHGYDLHCKCNFNITDMENNTYSGELNIAELADYNDIDSTEIKIKFNDEHDINSTLKKLFSSKKDKLYSQLEKWVNELKKQ